MAQNTTSTASTIVLVDDDADVRESIGDFLTDAGYDVIGFGNGASALTHLCQNPPPAVVLADMLMPGMNAWELAAQMRRRENLANIPLIVVTGSGPQWGSPVPERMVVRKPIDTTRLLTLIRQVTAQRPADDGQAEGGNTAASP